MKQNLLREKQKLEITFQKLRSLPKSRLQSPQIKEALHHVQQRVKVLSFEVGKEKRKRVYTHIFVLSMISILLLSMIYLLFYTPAPSLTGAVIGPSRFSVQDIPTITTPVLNSTNLTNKTSENLTLNYSLATSATKGIVEWSRNGSGIAFLMPFEGSSTNSLTKEYITNSTSSVLQALTYNSTGGYDGFGTYNFDANSNYVQTVTVNIARNFTVTMWVKSRVANQGGFHRIIESDYASGLYLGTDSAGTGYKFIVANGGSPYGAAEGGTILTDRWQFIAATYNTTHGILYIDGSQIASDTFTLSSVISDDLWIGKYPYAAGYDWNGFIDEIVIWNRSLSATQIQSLYENKTNLIVSSELVGGQQWTACVTPVNATADGQLSCSNTLTTVNNQRPTHGTPILNSTSGKNTSRYENITVYNISTSDSDGDSIKNIITWYTSNISFHTLNLPFEGSGNTTTKDYTNFSNNASNTGAVWNSSGGFDGRGAYRCDGTNNYLEVPLRGDSGNNLTVMFWAKPIGGSTGVGMFQWASSLNDGAPFILLQRDSSTSARWYTSGSYRFTNLTINDNTWYHFALTHNGSAWLHYVNGNLGGFSASAITGQSAAVSLYLCNGYWGYFGGMVDDMNVFNRSLSGKQILNYYSNRTNVFAPADTFPGEQWKACVTPNDNTTDGEEKCSNNITLFGNRVPSPGTVILNSTLGTNGDAENLTVYNTSSSDPDGDPYRNIITWYGQNIPYQILNLPFETYINNTRTRDYVNLSNNGSVEGANGGEPRWKETEGFNGKGAYECDGTDDYILSNLPGTTGSQVTISFWTKPTTDGTGVGAFAWQDSLTSGYPYILFQRLDANNFRLYVNNDYRISNLTTALGVWHHYAIKYNGSAWLAYVNGTLAGFYTGGQANQANALGLYLCNGWSGYYPGLVDDLKVYNRSLSSEQILNLYRGRDDILDANETQLGDKWKACITATDFELESTDSCSNTVTIADASNTAPTLTNISHYPDIIFENDTITVSTLYLDSEGSDGTVRFMWYRNGTSVYNETDPSIGSNTNLTATLTTAYFSHFDLINVTVIADDGTANSTQYNSTTTIISNSPPTMPIIGTPISGNTTVSRTPWFRWNNVTDTDNDNILYGYRENLTYNLLIDDNSDFNNPEVNVSEIEELSLNTSYNISTELNVDTTYFWRLRSYDKFNYSNYSATFNFTLDSYLALTIPQSNINFSILAPGERKNTTSGTPPPFRLENVGNINGNITIIANSWLFTAINATSNFYQFQIRENETNSFNTTASATSWTNMTLGSVLAHVVNLDWHDWKNDFLTDILVHVPSNESTGPKNSTVIFSISSQ